MRRFGRERPGETAFAACWGLSLAACIWIVLHLATRSGDLVDVHTDHIHHCLATWTFLHRGFDVYRYPFGGIHSPYPFYPKVPWPELTVLYPPGMFVVFLVPALAGAWIPMASATWAKLVMLWVVLLSHAGLACMARALSRVRGAAGPVLLVVWVLVLRMALCGFYDAAWLGLGALAIAALANRRPAAGLAWFAAAALVNYRAVSLLPVGALAAWSLLGARTPRPQKLAAFAFAAAACALVVATFWMGTKYGPPPDSPVFRSVSSPFLPWGPRSGVVAGLGAVMGVFALLEGDALLAASVALTAVMAILHGGPSWHGSLAVVPMLLVGVGRIARRGAPRHVVALRGALVVWFLVLEEYAFQNSIPQLVELLMKAKL